MIVTSEPKKKRTARSDLKSIQYISAAVNATQRSIEGAQ